MSVSGPALADFLHAQIEHVEAQWLNAYQRGDGTAAAALVSHDVIVINADGKRRVGGAAYAKLIERHAKVAKLSVKTGDVESLGDRVAMATGDYVAHVHTSGGQWVEQGHWVRVFVRKSGGWKIRASCFSE